MKILIIFPNISASSNNFWEHCSLVPPLFAPMTLLNHISDGESLVVKLKVSFHIKRPSYANRMNSPSAIGSIDDFQ